MDFLNLTQVLLFVQTVAWTITGKVHYLESLKFMEEGAKPYNEEFAQAAFPYLKWASWVLTLGRLVLIPLSYKYPRVSCIYFVYQMMFYCVGATFPQDFGNYQI